jgi:Flp pilus assembly pilin Flp
MLQLYVAAQSRLHNTRDFLAGLRKDESGAGILEYTLVVGLMAVFIAAAFTALQGNITTAMTNIGTKLSTIK